jgi:hypothetical protein
MNRTKKLLAALDARERIRQRLCEEHSRVNGKRLEARRTLCRRYGKMREELRKTGRCDPLTCEAKIHRVIVTSEIFPLNTFPWGALEELPRAQVVKPRRIFRQAYTEVTRIRLRGSIREIFVYTKPRDGWSPPFRVVIIPQNRTSVRCVDLEKILECLPNFKVVLVEFALDFPIGSIMDLQFVQRWVLFGKIWPRFVGINPLHDSWGTRKGTKFIRVYARFETDALRIEFELHSSFLRQHGVNHPADFVNLAGILRSHIFFAKLDQKRLVQQLQLLALSEPKIRNILEQVEDRDECLYGELKYLRRKVGLKNSRRILIPHDEVNQLVANALKRWSETWLTKAARKERRP